MMETWKSGTKIVKTKSQHTSFRKELTVRLGSKYRDLENTRKLMGDKQQLEKAFGIIAVCMFGPNLPTENASTRIDCVIGGLQPSSPVG